MKYQFFQIPVADAAQMQAELNAFISQHRIMHSDKYFVADSANRFLSYFPCLAQLHFVPAYLQPSTP